MSVFLADEQATVAFAESLAKLCPSGFNIFLYGDLGAGKTTLVRGLIQSFLPEVKVKSPTYTIVEDYDLSTLKNNPNKLHHIYHFDLYRLGDPEELEYLGARDYFSNNAVCLVEWPQRGEGWLTEPDVKVTLEYHGEGRNIELEACSAKGKAVYETINKKYGK